MMRVKSKMDIWFHLLIWVILTIIFMSIILIPQDQKVLGCAIGLPVMFVLIRIYFGSYYEFKENYLLCRIGPFFEKIKYKKIKSIKLSQSFASSMALSAKQIEICQHGKGYILGTTFISPVNREEFISELNKRCNHIEKTI